MPATNPHLKRKTPRALVTARLNAQEDLLSQNIIKLQDTRQYSSLSFPEKQIQFKNTVFAIKSIVGDRLYAFQYDSVEDYFRKKWGVSRAQVYRLMDCCLVLKDLLGVGDHDGASIESENASSRPRRAAGPPKKRRLYQSQQSSSVKFISVIFSAIPFKERMCRTLKTIADGDKHIARYVWAKALEGLEDPEQITANMISQAWNDIPLSLKRDFLNKAVQVKVEKIPDFLSALVHVEASCSKQDDTGEQFTHHSEQSNEEEVKVTEMTTPHTSSSTQVDFELETPLPKKKVHLTSRHVPSLSNASVVSRVGESPDSPLSEHDMSLSPNIDGQKVPRERATPLPRKMALHRVKDEDQLILNAIDFLDAQEQLNPGDDGTPSTASTTRVQHSFHAALDQHLPSTPTRIGLVQKERVNVCEEIEFSTPNKQSSHLSSENLVPGSRNTPANPSITRKRKMILEESVHQVDSPHELVGGRRIRTVTREERFELDIGAGADWFQKFESGALDDLGSPMFEEKGYPTSQIFDLPLGSSSMFPDMRAAFVSQLKSTSVTSPFPARASTNIFDSFLSPPTSVTVSQANSGLRSVFDTESRVVTTPNKIGLLEAIFEPLPSLKPCLDEHSLVPPFRSHSLATGAPWFDTPVSLSTQQGFVSSPTQNDVHGPAQQVQTSSMIASSMTHARVNVLENLLSPFAMTPAIINDTRQPVVGSCPKIDSQTQSNLNSTSNNSVQNIETLFDTHLFSSPLKSAETTQTVPVSQQLFGDSFPPSFQQPKHPVTSSLLLSSPGIPDPRETAASYGLMMHAESFRRGSLPVTLDMIEMQDRTPSHRRHSIGDVIHHEARRAMEDEGLVENNDVTHYDKATADVDSDTSTVLGDDVARNHYVTDSDLDLFQTLLAKIIDAGYQLEAFVPVSVSQPGWYPVLSVDGQESRQAHVELRWTHDSPQPSSRS